MAKVLDPLHSSEARGKVGGIIYNTSRGNKYVKTFTSPSKRRTSAQSTIRAVLATCARAWQALDDETRTAWAQWATAHPKLDWTGNSVSWTGANAYTALNTRLLQRGFTAQDDPPVAVGPGALEGLELTPGSGQISVAFTAGAGTGESVEIYLQGPMSPGAVGKINRATFNCLQPHETTPKVISGLSAGYYTVFARVLSEADGQVSPFVQAGATVS